MNTSAAINIFLKVIVRQKISFDIFVDNLFYSDTNIAYLKKSISYNNFIKDIDRNGNTGMVTLKHDLQGFWSRRIGNVNRLV